MQLPMQTLLLSTLLAITGTGIVVATPVDNGPPSRVLAADEAVNTGSRYGPPPNPAPPGGYYGGRHGRALELNGAADNLQARAAVADFGPATLVKREPSPQDSPHVSPPDPPVKRESIGSDGALAARALPVGDDKPSKVERALFPRNSDTVYAKLPGYPPRLFERSLVDSSPEDSAGDASADLFVKRNVEDGPAPLGARAMPVDFGAPSKVKRDDPNHSGRHIEPVKRTVSDDSAPLEPRAMPVDFGPPSRVERRTAVSTDPPGWPGHQGRR